MDNFTFIDGLSVSLFSMAVVFSVLLILSIILVLFSKLIAMFSKKEEVSVSEVFVSDDAEEKLVAQIVAACLIQKNHPSNVRIKSIVRVK